EGPQAYPQRLHHRLLGREAGGEALGRVGATGAGGPLAVGEQAAGDSGRAGQDPAEAVDLDGVDADALHVFQRSASRWTGCSSRSTTGICPRTSSRKDGSVSVTVSRRTAYRPR